MKKKAINISPTVTVPEPHARYQEVLKELAQARLGKKNKKLTSGK